AVVGFSGHLAIGLPCGRVSTASFIPAGGLDPRDPAGGPAAARPLRIAGLCLAGLALTWFVATLVPAGQARDAVALHDFTLLGRPSVDTVARAPPPPLAPPLFRPRAA